VSINVSLCCLLLLLLLMLVLLLLLIWALPDIPVAVWVPPGIVVPSLPTALRSLRRLLAPLTPTI
jgi:hypothetical protein